MIINKRTPKEIVLKLGSQCERSNHCCRFSTGILADGDLKRIAEHLELTEEEVKKQFLEEAEMFHRKVLRPRRLKEDKPYGRCVFLDESKGCTIQDVKPLMCRVYTCKPYGFELVQWFYLNHIVDVDDPESIRQWEMFTRFQEPIPGGRVEELVPDKERLMKIMNYDDPRDKKEGGL